jgi:hypothetical protein
VKSAVYDLFAFRHTESCYGLFIRNTTVCELRVLSKRG